MVNEAELEAKRLQDEVKKLEKRRSTYTGFITRTETWVRNSAATASIQRLEVELESLERNYNKLSDTEFEIIDLTGDDTIVGSRLETTTLNVNELKAKLKEEIDRKRPQPTAQRNDGNLNQTSPFDFSSLLQTPKCNLPKLSLPTFDGRNAEEFLDFINSFDSMVHKNADVDDIDKFRYLQSCLKGEARQVISQMELTAANYKEAYGLLTKRYDNKALIVQSHIRKLFAIPDAADDSALALRRLVDQTKSHVRALLSLGSKEELADALLIYLTSSKLATSTKLRWEETTANEVPTWDKFEQFIEERSSILERFNPQLVNQALPATASTSKSHFKSKPRQSSAFLSVPNNTNCAICSSSGHLLTNCAKFLALDPVKRYDEIKRLDLCIVCFDRRHQARECTGEHCGLCNKRHHKLLHFPSSGKGGPSKPLGIQKSTTSHTIIDEEAATILGTVIVKLQAENGHHILCRALLDSGSMRNFVTTQVVQILNPPLINEQISVEGISSTATQVNKSCTFELQSQFNDTIGYNISCLVLPRITGVQPPSLINTTNWNVPPNLNLADPTFMKPGHVDLLIGAELFWQILLSGRIELGDGLPILQETKIGWVVAGSSTKRPACVSMLATTDNGTMCDPDNYHHLDKLVERFWLLENIPDQPLKLTSEEEKCELHFVNTTRRDSDGRYIVRLPFKHELSTLGSSYQIAMKRFKTIERKLARDPNMYNQYAAFIDEYIKLGHCEVVDNFDFTQPHAFIPHHCVLKPQSSSTKLRVVYDASCKYSNGLSLNDVLMNGPKLQPDLIHTILKWRTYRYVISADVTKMYRQVSIDPEDCNAQLIIWRQPDEPNHVILRLKTVTYGTKPGGYLAVRCLLQLAEDEGANFPLGAEVLKKSSYVDDMFMGSNKIAELLFKRIQTCNLLARAGFKLSKFCSNIEAALAGVELGDRERCLEIDDKEIVKTLGVMWEPNGDEFHFTYHTQNETKILTKNVVLSQLARMYDPMGLLAPIVTRGKVFFQAICKAKIPWDTALPNELKESWENYVQSLQEVKRLKFRRSIFEFARTEVDIQLHGFCDASQIAYGACCYVRVVYNNDTVSMTLFQARSRVTPLKKETMDITRLELEAALLLSSMIDDLLKNVLSEVNISKVYCWTDSSVVFHWIHSEAHEFEVFVRNRVAKIQRSSTAIEWRHVCGEYNPADLISRGEPIETILEKELLWLYGPFFLKNPQSQWPVSNVKLPRVEAPIVSSLVSTVADDITDTMRFGQPHPGILRSFAYVLRFIERCKNPALRKARRREIMKRKNKYKYIDIPTLAETEVAEKKFIKMIQTASFSATINCIKQNKFEQLSADVKPLAPFIDTEGIIRVGGRLSRAQISYEAKHQILLPFNHRYSRSLLFFLHHFRLFHGGVQLIMRTVRERYWILNCRRTAKHVINNCLVCFKIRPKMASQLMGELPEARVAQVTAFLVSGVDFFGPFSIRHHSRCRFQTTYYVAIFVCFTTKAVHMEIVPDNTTEAFINALMRFIADRGRVKKIYSDNATNFQGTSNQLKQVQKRLLADREIIAAACQKNGVEWSFIPARSPNFGGLWEASVKIAKGLMKAVMQRTSYTYDEFNTLVRQVTVLINSRPITPQSEDPNDLEPLTPGHFIYGGSPSLLPVMLDESKRELVIIHQNIQNKLNQYWRRWSTEYFHLLQSRGKWHKKVNSIKVGTMVLLREDNVPPLWWPIGRITATFPDETGNIRVVMVKTGKGEYRRGITNVAPIPNQSVDDKPT